jgi:2-oxoglutarate ferredoxin oxidoreductase subunit alpha
MYAKYATIQEKEARYELIGCEDADIVLVAYGTTSRIARNAIDKCRQLGLKVGLLRPITLYPFPVAAFEKLIPTAKGFMAVEMSMGQMIDDVRISVAGRRPVAFFGRSGGVIPSPAEILTQVQAFAKEIAP